MSTSFSPSFQKRNKWVHTFSFTFVFKQLSCLYACTCTTMAGDRLKHTVADIISEFTFEQAHVEFVFNIESRNRRRDCLVIIRISDRKKPSSFFKTAMIVKTQQHVGILHSYLNFLSSDNFRENFRKKVSKFHVSSSIVYTRNHVESPGGNPTSFWIIKGEGGISLEIPTKIPCSDVQREQRALSLATMLHKM